MRVLLLSLRLGSLFLLTPLFAVGIVPARIRVLLIMGLSGALSLGLPSVTQVHTAFLAAHPGALVQAGLTELALGATMGAGIMLAFSCFTIAGRLLDVQIGFGMGQILDPISNEEMPVITIALNQIALVIFFLLDGHHILLRGIAYSLERFPLARPWPLNAAFGPIMKQAAGMFGLAFALAAPIVFCILLIEMALGVLSRNLPQINMLVMGIPIKIVVGLLTLALWMSSMGSVMGRIYGSIYRAWDGIFSSEAMQDNGGGPHL